MEGSVSMVFRVCQLSTYQLINVMLCGEDTAKVVW